MGRNNGFGASIYIDRYPVSPEYPEEIILFSDHLDPLAIYTLVHIYIIQVRSDVCFI